MESSKESDYHEKLQLSGSANFQIGSKVSFWGELLIAPLQNQALQKSIGCSKISITMITLDVQPHISLIHNTTLSWKSCVGIAKLGTPNICNW